jgi:hypothetical protein
MHAGSIPAPEPMSSAVLASCKPVCIMENFKFARICSATGRGINEGYCCHDGDFYFAEEQDLIGYLRYLGGYDDLSDEFVLQDAYEAEAYYYTEWEELDEDGWYESLYEDGREPVWVNADYSDGRNAVWVDAG